jgi:uncharacterized protein (TIGR00369 family)
MDGLGALQAIAEGSLPPPPIAALMNMEPLEVAPGRAVFVGVPGEEHYNPIGTVHGGWASTLLDSALGCAVQTTLPAGVAYTTLDLRVSFVRPIRHDTGHPRLGRGRPSRPPRGDGGGDAHRRERRPAARPRRRDVPAARRIVCALACASSRTACGS